MEREHLDILMVLPYFPYPPESGGRTRSFYLIQHLSEIDNVSLLVFLRDSEELQHLEALKPFCKDIHVVQRNRPFSPKTWLRYICCDRSFYETIYWSEAAVGMLKELICHHSYDVVHLECSYLGQYLRFLPPGFRFLLDPNIEYRILERYHDVTRNPALRALLSIDAKRLMQAEQRAWLEADVCGTVSAVDRAEILRLCPNKCVAVIPNGAEILAEVELPSCVGDHQILFTGNFRYFANVDAAQYFCSEVLPSIVQVIPEIEVWIVGVDAARKLRRLANRPRVKIIDRVPDLKPYLRSASVYVCPLRAGSGTKLKVLEAMAAQKAIVSTSVGAEGLEVENGRHMFISDEPTAFASNVIRLLLDTELRLRLARQARQLAVAQYSWRAIAMKLHEVYTYMVNSRRRA